MPADGAWHCEWPDCPRLAVTQLRTTLLGWMKTCRQHRNAWLTVPYGELATVYRRASPPRRLARVADRPAVYQHRSANGRP